MKILILHQHFKTPDTGGAIRSWYLAKGLVEHGHTPVVITAHNEKKYLHTTIEGIEVHYLPIPYDNAFDYYRRGAAFLRFVFGSIKIASAIEGIDRIYAISVPLTIAFVARWTSFRKGIPYFFEVGDLWPAAPIQNGFHSKSTHEVHAVLHRAYSLSKSQSHCRSLSADQRCHPEKKHHLRKSS
ncbi:MAG: glycosyltransferase [Bacteroidota bacterium]